MKPIRTELIMCMLLAAAVILAVAYAFYDGEHAITESFQAKNKDKDKNNLMFNGSYPSPPVVCLAGNSKIPCTAFSSG